MKSFLFLVALLAPVTAFAEGDPARGKRAFLQCVMCHSAVLGGHKSGPSLARIWGRKAATVEGFWNYSEALKQADIMWDAETLNTWLISPQAMVPGTSMRIQGIEDAEDRQDIIAYLKQLAADSSAIKQRGVTAETRMANISHLTPLQSHLDTDTRDNRTSMIMTKPQDTGQIINLKQHKFMQRLGVSSQ